MSCEVYLLKSSANRERWAYPLKFLCDLLDARIVDCGSGDFWNWDSLPDWIGDHL